MKPLGGKIAFVHRFRPLVDRTIKLLRKLADRECKCWRERRPNETPARFVDDEGHNMRSYSTSRFGLVVGLAILLWAAPVARAEQVPGYGIEAAAQEITQLFWLAETANACGWASEEDAMKFKHFSVRFLSAHLSDIHRLALISMVTESGYEDRVRQVARDSVPTNCDSPRWQSGWVAYKAAADAHEHEF